MNSIAEIFDNSKQLLDGINVFINKCYKSHPDQGLYLHLK